jgi:hypothetical protein
MYRKPVITMRPSIEGRAHGASPAGPRKNVDHRERRWSVGGVAGGGSTGDTIGGTGNVDVIEVP